MSIVYSNPTLNHVTISGNGAGCTYEGGGIYIEFSDPALNQLLITGNEASQGGGIFVKDSNPILTDMNAMAEINGLYRGLIGVISGVDPPAEQESYQADDANQRWFEKRC